MSEYVERFERQDEALMSLREKLISSSIIQLDDIYNVGDAFDSDITTTTTELILKLKEERKKSLLESRTEYEEALTKLQDKTSTSDDMDQKIKLSFLEQRDSDRDRYFKAYENAKKEHDQVIKRNEEILLKNNEYILEKQQAVGKKSSVNDSGVAPIINNEFDEASILKTYTPPHMQPGHDETAEQYLNRMGIRDCFSQHGPFVNIEGMNLTL